jgi:hypothetical protein
LIKVKKQSEQRKGNKIKVSTSGNQRRKDEKKEENKKNNCNQQKRN